MNKMSTERCTRGWLDRTICKYGSIVPVNGRSDDGRHHGVVDLLCAGSLIEGKVKVKCCVSSGHGFALCSIAKHGREMVSR